MKKLDLILALIVGASSVVLAADAANDVLLNQRNSANDDNVQRNVTATANSLFAFDGSLIPTATAAPILASVQANASGGLLLKNFSGTTVMNVGPGSGTGVAFNASGLTSVNSVTAPASTDLTLTGGSSGASLVLAHTAGASMSSASKLNLTNSEASVGSTSGALRVTGGIYAGAASVFGGAVTIGNALNFDTANAAGTRSINLGSTYGSGTWLIYNGATAIGSISSSGFSSNVGWKAPVGGGATFVDFGFSSGSGLYSPTANNISIANNNARVANFSTTALTLDYTTAGSAGAGALVIAGGLATGAASYLGGNTTVNGEFRANGIRLENGTFIAFGSADGEGMTGSQSANSLTLRTNSTTALTINSAQAATFAGAVTHTLGTNLPPQTAPASPASGWTLYTDSGDGNKLKAKASTGTVVTIGTP